MNCAWSASLFTVQHRSCLRPWRGRTVIPRRLRVCLILRHATLLCFLVANFIWCHLLLQGKGQHCQKMISRNWTSLTFAGFGQISQSCPARRTHQQTGTLLMVSTRSAEDLETSWNRIKLQLNGTSSFEVMSIGLEAVPCLIFSGKVPGLRSSSTICVDCVDTYCKVFFIYSCPTGEYLGRPDELD